MKEKSSYIKNNKVFSLSLAVLLLLVFMGIFIPTSFGNVTENLTSRITTNFGWFYLLLVTGILFFLFYLIVSPIGQIKLGNPNSTPDHSTPSWIAMMFSAGMGIGLVFYGAAEPLSHYAINTPIHNAGSKEALSDAFQYTFFHWGIHAWGVYAVVGLALAYFGFRKQEKYLLSATFKPLLADKSEGFLGKAIDIITIVATVIGVATTLGFGSSQINGGLSYLFGIANNFKVQTIIIIITTMLFILSAMSGLGKGVKILSNLNLILAVFLLALAIVIGPSVRIFDNLTDSIGDYLQNFLQMSFRSSSFDPGNRGWINMWTIFYWAWWISWSPFVGVFIARISKGRTIREFLTVVLLVPTMLSLLWFTTFGTLSTSVQASGVDLTGFATEEVLFATFSNYNLGNIMSIVALILIISFFVTSADSATFVLAMLSEKGELNPSNEKKLTWGILLAIIAISLLFSGGLDALQNTLIIVALPFSIVIIFMMVSLLKELNHEKDQMGLSITPDRLPKKNQPFKSYTED